MRRVAAVSAFVAVGVAWALATMTGAADAPLITGIPSNRVRDIIRDDATVRVLEDSVAYSVPQWPGFVHITVYPTVEAANEAYEYATLGWQVSSSPLPEPLGDEGRAAAPEVNPVFRTANVVVRVGDPRGQAMEIARQLDKLIKSCPRAPEGQRELKLPVLHMEYPEEAEYDEFVKVKCWVDDDVDLIVKKPDTPREQSWIRETIIKDNGLGWYVEEVWDATSDHVPFHGTIRIKVKDPHG